LKWTFRNDSIKDIYIYIPDCVPKKVACLKEKVGTLVFQPHLTIYSCEALCTYSLYDKQVNGAGAWQTEWFIKPFLASIP
jgi:hypothetical protein